MRQHWIGYLVVAVIFTLLGFFIAGTDHGAGGRLSEAASQAKRATLEAVARRADLETRTLVLMEYPGLIPAIARGGGFGGQFSRSVGQNMFSRLEEPIREARKKTRVVEVAPRTWLIRLPIVNAALFETDAGLVLVDTGMAPAGPALLEAIRSVSDAPLHTVIYTHGHVDHAYGTWALLQAGETPEIVAHERLPARFRRYIRLRGSIAKYMSQPLEHMPEEPDDLVWPTRTFRDRLQLDVGGESFVLQHHPGETDDQLYVWVPERRALASADYCQGFLPNAGNGKRVQRHVEEWAAALREMAELEPTLLLPGHGEALTDPAAVQENLLVLAEALRYIVDHTLAGLNAGLRKEQVWHSLELPAHLAAHPTLQAQYVSPQDISKTVIRRYTGWWDDVPSHWTPAPVEEQARTIVELAGGMETLAARARELLEGDPRLASHLADWAFFADPQSPEAQQLVIEVYRRRILDPASNTQEMLAYLDAMVAARQAQLDGGAE
jgi:alkyl sulfatase BDS1-like metallo-beta-lactamase superfamily hydrolase